MQDRTFVETQVTREASSLMVQGAALPCRDWLGMHHLAELFCACRHKILMSQANPVACWTLSSVTGMKMMTEYVGLLRYFG